jgi:hypothetical protein
MATTADYFVLEWRPSVGRLALRCVVDEIPLEEVGHAEDQLRSLGSVAKDVEQWRSALTL